MIRGVIAVGRGELKRAVDLLSRARSHAHVFGGSHAQRDAIDLTLLAAAAAAAANPVSGDATDDALVRALVAERAARKQTAERAARLVIDASLARARRRGRARHSAPRTPQPIEVTMTADRYESLDEFDLLNEDAAEFGLSWDGPPAVTRLSVAAGSGAVSVRRWGTEVPDLVLLHGAALNAHTLDTFALAAKRPLLALDLPGHGESAWRDDAQYGPETLVPAVAEVIREHAKAPVTIVGQSLGGLMAIALAAAHPALVGRLVLVDVTPGMSNATQVRSFLAGPTVFASRAEIVERTRAFGFGRSDESVARGVWHNTRVREDGTVVWKHHLGNLGGTREGGTREGGAREGGAREGGAREASAREASAREASAPESQAPPLPFDFTTLWPALEAFGGPVLLVRGEHGFLTQDDAGELRRRVPGAQVRTVLAGHNVQEDDPVLLAEVVGQFLGGAAQ